MVLFVDHCDSLHITTLYISRQKASSQSLKSKLLSDTVMTYSDPSKPIEIIVDASRVLVQDSNVVAYASRAYSGRIPVKPKAIVCVC